MNKEEDLDYKAEYEKLINQKQKEEDFSNFQNLINENGYLLKDESVDLFKECSKEELTKFGNLINGLKHARTVTNYSPNSGSGTNVAPKATFEDALKTNK